MDPQNTESRLPLTNVEAIFADLCHQVDLLDEVSGGHSLSTDIRDRFLLSLTALQNDLDSKEETALNSVTHLETLFRLIDCRDLLLSCCSSRLVKRIAVRPSCQDVVEVALIHQWSEMLSFRCTSAAGILHRIEILCDIYSKRSTGSSLCDDSAERGLQVSMASLMTEQWEAFLRFVFHSNSAQLQQDYLYPNIVLSTCRLWRKLMQTEVQKSSVIKGNDSTHHNIFLLTNVLLERLQTGSLSQISHRKCLGVLLECLPYSSFLSPLKILPSLHLHHELARRNLRAFKHSGAGESLAENPAKLSRGDWVRRCVMRSSISQGFGGFCGVGKTCSDCGVVVDGERTLGGDGAVDETVLRKLVLLWLRSLAVEAHSSAEGANESSSAAGDDVWVHLKSMESSVCSLLPFNPDDWLMRLFDEQDDDLFDALLCLLDIYVLTANKRSSDADLREFDPCRIFLLLLENGCWDHTLLLDLLMSPETCFLLYLTRLLKHILSDWNRWVSVCRSDDRREENVSSAAELDVDLSQDFSRDNLPVEEFDDDLESVETERIGSSVSRLQPCRPLSSLKQLEENYTGLLSERDSSVNGCSSLQENSVPGSSHFSFLSGEKSNAVPDLYPIDVGNRSSLKRIIDYSDSDSDRSELDGSLENGVNDEKSDSSRPQAFSDDNCMASDVPLDCSDDLEIRTPENRLKSPAEFIAFGATNSLRQANEVDIIEIDLRNSSHIFYKCQALDCSKSYSCGSCEHIESETDVESNSTDVMLDGLTGSGYDDESVTSLVATPAVDPPNEGVEKRDNLVDAMTTIIRLRLCLTRLVSKDIFPYDIGPLERLLRLCEENYEAV